MKDINPGTPASSPATFTDSNQGFVYFVAQHNLYGRELWRTDGTNAGFDI